MRFMIPIFCLILTSCAAMHSEMRMAQIHGGTSPYKTKSFTPQEISITVEFITQELQMGKLPVEWEIVLVDKFITARDSNGNITFADGATDPKNKIIYIFVYQDCLAASALTHELVHALAGKFHHRETVKAVARSTYKKAVKHFCGQDFKKKPIPNPGAMF